MELQKGFHFLQVEKRGVVDSSSVLAIRDSRGFALVEVGGGGEQNVAQTLALLEKERLDVRELHTVIVSHTHADHMGAIAHFRGLVPGISVLDHELDAPFLGDSKLLNRIFDAELVARTFPGSRFDILEFYANFCPISETRPDRTVTEGETLPYGDYTLEVVHTPGHHPGHISLFERATGILFVGDMLGMEVPFYTPSSGGVSGYLESLGKYRSLDPKVIVPSHGELIEDPTQAIEKAEDKVRRREERLLDALATGPRTFHELLPALFRNLSQYMFPGTAILASHLEKMRRDGLLEEDEARYRLAESPGSS